MQHILAACQRYWEVQYHLEVSCHLPTALEDHPKIVETGPFIFERSWSIFTNVVVLFFHALYWLLTPYWPLMAVYLK